MNDSDEKIMAAGLRRSEQGLEEAIRRNKEDAALERMVVPPEDDLIELLEGHVEGAQQVLAIVRRELAILGGAA